MGSFTRYFVFLFFAAAVSLGSSAVLAQATLDKDNTKDACDGLDNGTITLTITDGVPPFTYTLIRLSDFTIIGNNVPMTLGVPVTLNGLAPSAYFIGINDGDLPAPNLTDNFTIANIATPITAATTPVNNTSCAIPNGSITLNPSGGSGEGFSFSWTATNGFTSNAQNISGLVEADYTVVISDDSTNCSITVGPIHIDDPSPLVQNVNPTGTQEVCAGSPASISIDDSEVFPVVYEILLNGNPTGVTANGTGNPLTLILPNGSYADGDVLTLQATNQLCSPTMMNGSVTIAVIPLPTITGLSVEAVCAGSTTANLSYTATTGSPNQYSIDFDVAAEGAGFADIANVALPASPIVLAVPGAAAPGTYNATITVRNTVTGCGSTVVPVSILINANPTITLGANPSVCIGSTTANLTYSGTTGAPNQYSIDFNGAAEVAGFVDVANAVLPASPIVITVPGAATPGTYSGTLTVVNTVTGCPSGTTPISVIININPTITLGVNPTVCAGSPVANLNYSGTTGSPDQYSIDYNAAAEAQGFTDVVNAALPANPIGLVIPGGAAAGVYNATITVRNSVTGCVSGTSPLSITVNPSPTITLGANPAVCIGSATADLTYSATTDSPDQYSIDFNAAAEAQGFADISNAPLPASPIVINIPGAAVAGTYAATITVHNTVTGCSSAPANISVTINANPTITLGANPSVCSGSTIANLAYTATTGSPDRYSINFDAAAEAAGFTDVSNAVLSASPLIITIPGAGAPGTYNATLTVTNSVLGCGSSTTPISITINPTPTIIFGANPVICQGVTVANVPYTGTTGSPNQYRIDFNAVAEAQGFVDVPNTPLPASPIGITVPAGAAPGLYSYTVVVSNNITGCVSGNLPKQIRINPNPTITLGPNPSVCQGAATANLTYTATTGSANRYSINFDAAAEAVGFADIVSAALPVSPISISIPGGAGPGIYQADLSVLATTTTCSSTLSPITITIVAQPTITLGINPTICAGITAASVSYSATTGSPDQVSVDFDAAAEAQGFVDVVNAALPASSIVITVPGGAVAGTYNAALTVRNSGAGCASSAQPISVTINPAPAITPGPDPSVCLGSVSANLPYSAPIGAPDRYNLDFDASAEAAGFTDIVNTPLPASPIVITVPGAAIAGTYSATLTVSNTVSGCAGSSLPVTVTIVGNPSITLAPNPSVCTGSTSVNLAYSATTGSPDQFAINFDAAAEAAGFSDIVNASLTASPIVVTVPGAATAGTYSGTITVHNTTAGCSSTGSPVSIIIVDTPTITTGPNPTVCSGSVTADLTYSATTGAPDQYSLDFNAAAEAAGFADVVNAPITASPLVIVVPGAAPNGTYSANLTVRNSSAGCGSAATVVSVTILSNPSITLGPNPSVCVGSTTVDIGYTSTAGAPDQFSLDFDAAAEAAGFVDIVSAPLTASPIVVNIPGAAIAGAYNASLIVSNSAAGCSSAALPVTITIDPAATITLGANPFVCSGDTIADLSYSAVTGGVDLYSINFDVAAEAQGFADVVDVVFTSSPIQVSVPATVAGIYNGVITVRNSSSGCFSAGDAFTVEILDAPSITPGPDPVVCVGMPLGDLTYSATTGGADQYSIDFTAAAEAQGFVDIANALLPASPIQIPIPGGAIAGTYDAVLTVHNTVSGCNSAGTPIQVTITTAATVDAGAPQIICAGNTATLVGAFTGSTGATWSTFGDGTFADANDPATTYTPGPNDLTAGSVILTLTTAGPCAPVSDDVTITINPAASVDAGSPQTICAGSTVNLVATFSGSATGILWTSSGDGSFTDPTDVNATYTPGPGDLTAGGVTLTATAAGTCTGVADNVVITVDPIATVDAGTPQTICAGSVVPLSATVGGSATAITWTTSGDGTFDDATILNAIYTPGVNDIASGSVTLTTTTNNPAGPCPAANDNVVITIDPVPGDQVTFGNESWIGYVYDDSGNPAPPVTNIDFAASKYRGFIDETDISGLGSSSYDVTTDQFDLNLSNNIPLQGPNVCGSFLDNFSLRYKMTKTMQAGIYTFTVGSDDGVRFFIDGVAVDLNNGNTFNPHAYTTFTSDAVCITAGTHDFVIEYYENSGFSRLTFQYQLAPAPDVTTPVALCVNSAAPTLTVSSTDPGVTGFNWYADATLSTVLFSGTSFTPGAADLDMSTVASTDFFVTAVYACGETQAAQVVVDVIDAADITVPLTAVQICQTGGIVDLTTLVSAVPGPGTFTFTGTGVTTSPNFDPTLVAGTTTITVDYVSGTCTDTKTFDIDVINNATITIPAADVTVCQGGGLQDITALVSALPAGGTFTFTGAGVTGTDFDPSAQTGIVPVQVDYQIGGCSDTQTFNFNVILNATLTPDNTAVVCPNAADVNLLGLIAASPAGGTFTFTGPGVTGNMFDPTGSAGATATINVSYDLGGCTATGAIQITVRSAADPVCNGGSDCGALTIFPITTGPTRIELPTCANQDDGQLVFDVNLFAGGDSNFEFTLTRDGDGAFSQQQSGSGPFVFSGLYPDTYHYTVVDLINGHTCGPKDFTLVLQSVVTATADPASLQDVSCFGEPTGQVVVNATGSTTGQYYYSIDGVAWTLFIPGNAGQITNLPPNGTYSILVGEVANDVCYDTVQVTINNINPDLTVTFATTDATCNSNDGSITVNPPVAPNVGGGGPYQYAVTNGVTTTPFQDDVNFDNLGGGTYSILVRDGTSCVKTISGVNVSFPGFVDFTVTPTAADCSNNGSSGNLSVRFLAAGTYEAGISTDPLVEPASYVSYTTFDPANDVPLVFGDLSRGTYYIFAKTGAALCPTRQGPFTVEGVYALSFNITPICEDNEVSISLTDITGEPGLPFEIVVFKKFTSTPLEIIPVPQIPVTGSYMLAYDDYDFLHTTDEYQIQIQQIQSGVFCLLSSSLQDYRVQERLYAEIGAVSESYPDILNGKMHVVNFNGGSIPYDIRIELDSAAVGGQFYQTDWEEVLVNSNLQYQKTYERIPAGRYNVQVMDSVGCVIELVGRVPLDTDIYVPNIFTPNDDGYNDIFFVRNLPPADAQLTITNRWGKQIYSSGSYQNNWDANGIVDGIYFYRLKVSDGDPITGWVEILRGSKP